MSRGMQKLDFAIAKFMHITRIDFDDIGIR